MATYISDTERRLALVELLAHADPVDNLRRHRVVLEGHPDRHKQVPQLASAYVQLKLHELRERESVRHPANRVPVVTRASASATNTLAIGLRRIAGHLCGELRAMFLDLAPR